MISKISLLALFLQLFFLCTAQQKLYVADYGNDSDVGTFGKPLKTLWAAFEIAKKLDGIDVCIELRGGTYSQSKTLQISSADFLCRSMSVSAYQDEKVTVTGSAQNSFEWQPHKDGILKAHVELKDLPDQFFANGKPLHMARYPDYDSAARVFNGTAADAISSKRVANWKNPAGGYIHALHEGEWGDFHYEIKGKDDSGKLVYDGGWQNNRPAPMHSQHRFVENIFEELDAPGEWYYDRDAKTIYLYPPKGIDLKKTVFATSSLTDLIHINGSVGKPVKNIFFKNIKFEQTARSFMLIREPLLRSDWCIYRGGAILLDGTENISIINCEFSQLGGNAVFVSNYSQFDTVLNNHIHNIGGNALAFVGSAGAVRSPAFRYGEFVPWDEMDYGKGPKTNNYPQNCLAAGNLIHEIGTTEKQVAGVQLSMAAFITVRHNTIYSVPRSGINVSEGTWGGHIIEYNDVFNTVLETGDHGAYNSWGRDRYWRPERDIIDSIVAAKQGIELLDLLAPITIRNNRFQCDHGWDIDLDDGSTNYLIYNNVCLNGGLKLREGYHRAVTNNILINNTFHPHVWLKSSGDVFAHNIVTTPYAPILMTHWGMFVDSNFFLTKEGLIKARALGLDGNSYFGDAGFVNPITGDFNLKKNSPALKTGFKNFGMKNFGVTLAALKKIAKKPPIKPLLTKLNEIRGIEMEWLGANLKNIESLGERSAAGLHNYNGALVVHVRAGSLAAKSGMEKGDVIVRMGVQAINSINDLIKIYQSIKWMGHAKTVIVRNQGNKEVILFFK